MAQQGSGPEQLNVKTSTSTSSEEESSHSKENTRHRIQNPGCTTFQSHSSLCRANRQKVCQPKGFPSVVPPRQTVGSSGSSPTKPALPCARCTAPVRRVSSALLILDPSHSPLSLGLLVQDRHTLSSTLRFCVAFLKAAKHVTCMV